MITIFLYCILGAFPAPGVQELYQLDDEWLIDLGASPDLARWWCVTTDPDRGLRLIADGQPGEWFEEIDPFKVAYSDDGAHLAYVATRGGRQVVVRDGKEEKEFEKICHDYELPLFSADGKHLAYTAKDSGGYFVVRDGKTSQAFDGVWEPVFSADGTHLAFAGRKNDRWAVIVDGKVKNEHDFVEGYQFLPNGILMYVARDGDQWFVVRGSSKGPAYDEVSQLLASPDGLRYAYAARTGEKWRVVIDGKPGKEYDNAMNVFFSPSGKRLAYAAGAGNWVYDGYWNYNRFDGSFGAVLDGQELHWGPEDYEIDYMTFSADEAHFAYSVGKIGEGFYVVVDTTVGPKVGGIRSLDYAPVGNRLAFSYYQPGDSHFVAVGDLRFGPYFDSQSPFFSWDGSRLVYACRRGPDWRVAIDGVEQPDAFDRINYLRIAPDRKSAGLVGIRGTSIRRVVYDLLGR